MDLEEIFDRGFSQKERDFCLFFVGDAQFKWSTAAQMAGYANPLTEGARLKNRAHIVAAIAQLMEARNRKIEIGPEWVLTRLLEVEHDAAVNHNRKDRLKAIELIGKHVDVRAFREQHGLSGPEGEPLHGEHDLSHLSEEELDQLEAISRKIYARRAAGTALNGPLSALDDRAGEGAPEGGG